MAERGGQSGNNNAGKAKPWQAAINRALAKRSKVAEREALDDLAEKLLEKCDEGDLAALREMADRIEGRAAQSMTLSGDEDAPLITRIERVIVNTTDQDS